MNRTQLALRARLEQGRLSGRIVVLWLAVGALLLLSAGPAAALSGYATDQPAVNAQYPDALRGGSAGAGGGGDGSLRSLLRSGRAERSRPRSEVRERSLEREIKRKATATLSRAGLAPVESATLGLLLAAVGVASIGGLVRWRRGVSGV